MRCAIARAGILALLAAAPIVQADEALRRQALSLFGRLEAPAAPTPEAELGRALCSTR